jgi:DHA1 family tetracycline resistance protein-like MFS transporter
VRRPVFVVCLAVFGLMAGQQLLNPVLPPLAREFGFSELALGAVWAVGGAGVVLASPFWGRRSAGWGHRPVTAKVSPFDRRLWPFLTIGSGLYLALAIVLMTAGFLVQDRLGLAAADTSRVTSLVMLAGAGLIMLVQVVAVPRLGWTPLRLVRVGAVVMTAGMVVVAAGSSALLLGAGVAVLGAGMGFATPGFMSAPTLLTTRDEQGAVAGLMGSGSALAFMGGPLLGTGLYEISPAVPYVVGAVLLAGLAAFAFTLPREPAKAPAAA